MHRSTHLDVNILRTESQYVSTINISFKTRCPGINECVCSYELGRPDLLGLEQTYKKHSARKKKVIPITQGKEHACAV